MQKSNLSIIIPKLNSRFLEFLILVFLSIQMNRLALTIPCLLLLFGKNLPKVQLKLTLTLLLLIQDLQRLLSSEILKDKSLNVRVNFH